VENQNNNEKDFARLTELLKAKRKAQTRGSRPPSIKEIEKRTQLTPEAPAPRTNAKIAELGEEPTTQALEAWAARVRGAPIIDLAHAMGIGIKDAKALIKEVHDAIHEDLKENLSLNRQLDLDRIDGLLSSYYPQAKAGDVECANVVLRALKARAQLVGLEAPPDPGRSHPETVMIWLQNSLPNINKLVDSLPLELPPSAP
jgi:hypothetical protein